MSAAVRGLFGSHGREVLSSCCSQVAGSHVGLGSRGPGTGALYFAEDVQDHDAADVDETDQHDGLGAELEALGVLEERGQLVALSVGTALALREGRAFVLGHTAIDD